MRRVLNGIAIAILFTMEVGASSALAGDGPLSIYDNGLATGWDNWSYADVVLEKQVSGDAKPIEVKGKAWSALVLHHAPFSVKPYSSLTFYINGGLEGGQNICVNLALDDEYFESGFCVQPRAKTWSAVTVPLNEYSLKDGMIDRIILQAMQPEPYSAYYVAKISLE